METYLVNLKILAKIPKNGRIKRLPNSYIGIENDISRLTCIKRYLNSDSRNRTIQDINTTINMSIEKNNYILNSKYFRDHKKFDINNSFISDLINNEYITKLNLLIEITEALRNSVIGISNLKFTYDNDPECLSKLDIILGKIHNHISKVDKIVA